MPDIPVYPNCNINCVFCSNPVVGFRGTESRSTYAEFLKKWRDYMAGKRVFLKFAETRDFVSLTGGEPTLHPDFFRILATIRRSVPDHRIKLLTNARLCRHKSFARLVTKLGGTPFEIAVPMFGYDRKSHESISRAPGSFADTCAGVDNLFASRLPGQRIECRMILTRIQMRYFPRVLKFLLERFPGFDSLDLLFVEMEGSAAKYADQVGISMSECAQGVDAEFATLKKFKELRLLHFPLCVVPRRLWPFVWNTLDPLKVTAAPACRTCRLRKSCVGIGFGYSRFAGFGEFKPPRAGRGPAPSGDWYRPFGAGAST